MIRVVYRGGPCQRTHKTVIRPRLFPLGLPRISWSSLGKKFERLVYSDNRKRLLLIPSHTLFPVFIVYYKEVTFSLRSKEKGTESNEPDDIVYWYLIH